jgi:hypothetical protein
LGAWNSTSPSPDYSLVEGKREVEEGEGEKDRGDSGSERRREKRDRAAASISPNKCSISR